MHGGVAVWTAVRGRAQSMNVGGEDVGLPAGIVHHRVDLRRREAHALVAAFAPEAVVHLGVVHNFRISPEVLNARNVLGTDELLKLVVTCNVPKLVVLSSGDVYGPSPANSHFLSEEAPLLASQRFPEVRTLVAVDRAVQSFFWRYPAVETVLLRPAHIVGPNVRNAPSPAATSALPLARLIVDEAQPLLP